MFRFARRMVEDWSTGYLTRQMDEWLQNRSKLTDFQMAKVITLVNEQRRVFERRFNANFFDPPSVLAAYPTIGATLE
jgi:hypothetical protein